MQGFNRYIPPDYDPKQNSTLNSHQGKKHALGKRAKDIDKGILIVRFELPFNIWCGTCGSHIGAGVRYNAQKKKVGNYYSTPIFGFRCKCHLCSGWFELRTDPKNAAYEVYEGAKKKDEDWNPEENGGYAVHDTEAPSASQPPEDPFGHIEKTIDQQTWAKQNSSRISELSHASDRLSSDPYLVSAALRRRFREEKKEMLEKQGRDDELRGKYGLHDDVDLGVEDVELGREMWEAGRERLGLPLETGEDATGESSIRATGGTPRLVKNGKAKGDPPDLGSLLRRTTARKYDPFSDAADAFLSGSPVASVRIKAKVKDKEPGGRAAQEKGMDGLQGGLAGGGSVRSGMAILAGYDSD